MCVVDTHSLLEKLTPGLCPRVCVCEINTHNLEKLRVGLCPGVCVCVGGVCGCGCVCVCVGVGVCVLDTHNLEKLRPCVNSCLQ